MPRKRMIDPRIWDSEQVMQLSPEGFKLYIYLISQSDDSGRMRVSPSMIASRIYPFGGFDAEKCKNTLDEMNSSGLIILYEVDSIQYLEHPNWLRYQKIDRPSISTIPQRKLVERSSKARRPLVPNVIEVNRIEFNIAADAASDDDLFPTSDEGKKELSFYHAIEKSFFSKNDDTFTDYGKEGKAIKNLIKKARARAPDSPEVFMAQMIDAFWKLKNSSDKFFGSQPFIPSALNASGIWDRVLETLRDKSKSADPIAMKIAKGEIL